MLPECQSHGVATVAAILVFERVQAHAARRPMHAFPSVDHAASKAACRRLGFELLGKVEFEQPERKHDTQ